VSEASEYQALMRSVKRRIAGCACVLAPLLIEVPFALDDPVALTLILVDLALLTGVVGWAAVDLRRAERMEGR